MNKLYYYIEVTHEGETFHMDYKAKKEAKDTASILQLFLDTVKVISTTEKCKCKYCNE